MTKPTPASLPRFASSAPCSSFDECLQTLKRKLDVIDKFTKGEEADLAAELVGLEGATLVCWQHEAIPEIAGIILGRKTGFPATWPPSRFDVVWRFARDAATGPWTFEQVCQRLLSGDGPSPIA